MNLQHWQIQHEFEAGAEVTPGTLASTRPTSVSWSTARFSQAMLAVAFNDGSVRVWGYNDTFRRWVLVYVLEGHTACVHEVSWAPDMGRSYHLLASASQDTDVRIWKISKHGGGTTSDAAAVRE